MGTLQFSFLPGNKSIPKSKCNLTFIPGLFADINCFFPQGNIFPKKKLSAIPHSSNLAAGQRGVCTSITSCAQTAVL